MNHDYKTENPAELKRRLAEAEGVLEGLRSGRITSIPGAENRRVVTAIDHQRLAFVIEGSRLGTWEWDILDNTTIFNETWAQLLGYTLAELSPYSSHTREKLVHPEDLGRVLRAIADCLSGKTPHYECEFRMRHKEGHWLWILDRGMVMARDESGRPLRMFGTHADVTARKNTEEVTRARQRYLDTILETTVDGFWILDGNGHFLECNQAYCRFSGYSRDEILSMHLRDVEALESDVDIARHCERIINRGAELFKTMHRRKDGSVFPVEVSATWLADDGGRFISFGRDLTERQRRDARISLLGEMLDAAPTSITIHDTRGRFLFANQITARMHGYRTVEEFMTVNLYDLDTPDSRARVDARLQHITTEGASRFEVAHYRRDGSIIPLEILAKFISWDDTPAVLSIATDISARKQAEKRLEEQNHFISTILDNLPIGLAVNYITEETATYINQSFERIYGWPADELQDIRRFFAKVFPEPEYRRILEERIRQDIASGDPGKMVWENIEITRKDGSKRIVSARNIPLFEQNMMISTVLDVTEQRQAIAEQENLREQLHQARQMAPKSREGVGQGKERPTSSGR
jgi:PAS domain S-box-containing protein